ncbi:MAG: ABC transporter ATP-binding protein/permease [Bacilli bacterium]|nr:ABC transporter ATP-binding protein/permease [Bacilli bacterium]
MLKVKNLHKYYHNFGQKPLHVINDTSLEIPETGIIAVVGASGAGKTTLVNAISGLDSFKSGTIEFDETTVNHYRTSVADKMRMKNYGFIFQNYYLLEKETVYENVKVSLDAFDISESEKKKRVNYVLNQLGIGKYMNKLVTSLSGGEQQRVAIARALVKSPRIIFADEPTGSLDEITTFNVLNIFKQISKKCAVFIVTHERDIISYYADYIIEIDEGVVVKRFEPKLEDKKHLSIDQNIYLDELEHKNSFKEDNFSIDLYSDGEKNDPTDIKIAIKDGKIFLESSKEISVLTSKSENHIVKGKRKSISDYVKDDFDYELEPLPYSSNKLGFKEIVRKGFTNFKTKRKTKTVLKFLCLALSVLTVGLMEGFATISKIDLSEDLTASQGNLYLNVTPSSLTTRSWDMDRAAKVIGQYIVTSDLPGEFTLDYADKLYYRYEGFSQIKNQQFAIPTHDFKNINSLDSSFLSYGEMPKNGYEVVVDEYVLSNLVKKSILQNIVTNYGYFVGKTFKSSLYNYEVTISGVCRTENPTIYGYEGLMFARLTRDYEVRVIDLEYAKTLYPELENVSIGYNHCLINEEPYSNILSLLAVDGTFKDIPYDYIVNKATFDTLKYILASSNGALYVQTDGSEEVVAAYNELMGVAKESLAKQGINVNIEIVHSYELQKEQAVSNFNNILSTVTIVAYVILGVALILVILSTYLSMLSQISDIAVYRSLGYSRSFLGMIYLFELGLLAFLYTFIGGLVTYFGMFLVDIVPLVNYSIAMPFGYVLLALLAISLSIILIGLIPIMFVFRLTPASIYSRYNRKITNE